VHQLAAEIDLSERQLRRRCQHAFGYPPAMLARLLRLHRFLDLARTAQRGTGLAALATAAGYADQPHLTRESRALTGRRPSAFLHATPPTSEPFKTEPLANS
jgi:transcriptional regulator GlxA family with amidase domain